ncbi:MAG: metal-dependent hydrolase [Halothece sp.]
MMSVTHAVIAAAGTSLVLASGDPLVLGLAVVGSQLPDLDTTTSLIGQICYPISNWIEERYPHRSVTHSFLATAFIAVAGGLPLYFFLGESLKSAIALPLGHLLACFSDAFTKQGVQLFFPNPAWAISVSNPNRRLTTGGTGEYWVLATATAILVLGIWLAGGGGATQKVGSSLGLADAQIRKYNQLAANHVVWANIKGVYQSDRAPVEDRFLVVGEESGFIVMSSQKDVYKVGDGLIADRLVINKGQSANIQLSSLAFDDENLATRLSQVRNQYPGSLILVNGTVSVDFPEDITLSQQPDQLNTIKLSGTNVTLTYCPISEAITVLNDQWAIGSLTIKIINPSPWQ